MKRKIRLLKSWKNPADNKDYAPGTVFEIEGEDLVKQLLLDGIAQLVTDEAVVKMVGNSEDTQKAIDTAVEKAVSEKMKAAAPAPNAPPIIKVHDRSDDDPTHGYCPETSGREHTKQEKLMGLGQFCKDVYQAGDGMARPNERLKKSIERSANVIKEAGTGLTVTEDDSLGAMIPPELSTMLLDVAAETAIIRPRCTTLTIGAPSINLPRVKDYDRSGGLVYGGVLAYWKGENAALSESRPKIEDISLNLHCLTVLAYASDQAMRFSPVDVGAYLLPKMGSAITFKEEDAFVNGTGAGMPKGILNAASIINVTKQTGQTTAANVIVTKNVDDMIARIKVSRSASTVFLYNRPQLYSWIIAMTRAVGTGGQLAMLFQPGSTGTAGGFGVGNGLLNGIPIFDSEHMPDAGTAGDLTLVDLSNYIIADDRRGAEIAQSIHLKFDYSQVAFRILKYLDGQNADTAVTTRHKGTATVSPVVCSPTGR